MYDSRQPEPEQLRKLDARLTVNVAEMVEAMYDRLGAAGLLDEPEKLRDAKQVKKSRRGGRGAK